MQIDPRSCGFEKETPLTEYAINGLHIAAVTVEDQDILNAVAGKTFHRIEEYRQPRARLGRETALVLHVVLGNAYGHGHGHDHLWVQAQSHLSRHPS